MNNLFENITIQLMEENVKKLMDDATFEELVNKEFVTSDNKIVIINNIKEFIKHVPTFDEIDTEELFGDVKNAAKTS